VSVRCVDHYLFIDSIIIQVCGKCARVSLMANGSYFPLQRELSAVYLIPDH